MAGFFEMPQVACGMRKIFQMPKRYLSLTLLKRLFAAAMHALRALFFFWRVSGRQIARRGMPRERERSAKLGRYP